MSVVVRNSHDIDFEEKKLFSRHFFPFFWFKIPPDKYATAYWRISHQANLFVVTFELKKKIMARKSWNGTSSAFPLFYAFLSTKNEIHIRSFLQMCLQSFSIVFPNVIDSVVIQQGK